jgi:hypothetical protein
MGVFVQISMYYIAMSSILGHILYYTIGTIVIWHHCTFDFDFAYYLWKKVTIIYLLF